MPFGRFYISSKVRAAFLKRGDSRTLDILLGYNFQTKEEYFFVATFSTPSLIIILQFLCHGYRATDD